MEKNKNLWIGLAVVVVIVLLVWVVSKNSSTSNGGVGAGDQTALESTEDVGPGSVNAGAPAATLSYAQALVKYKDARLQLNRECQGSPDKMTFKNGALLMVDNRSAVARTVKVGSVFPIKAYGFKLVKLSSATLPTTWYVDCDTSQNVSTILIQK